MPHTVAAIFESESQANQARSELINLGIPSDDIYVRYDSGQAQRASSAQDADEDSGIGRFFKRLFGFENDDYHVSYYSQVINEGRYLVAVDAPTDKQAERAADMMHRLGAVDIDDLDVSRSATRPGAQAGAAPMNRGDTAQRGARSSGDEIPLQGRAQRGGVRVYTRAYDIPAEEKIRLREERSVVGKRLAAEQKPQSQHPHLETMDDDPYAESMFTKPKRKTDERVEQLAAEQKPQPQHPHLETMDDDPYAESMFTKPKQQK